MTGPHGDHLGEVDPEHRELDEALAVYSSDGQDDDPSGNDAAQATMDPEAAAAAPSEYVAADPDHPADDQWPPPQTPV